MLVFELHKNVSIFFLNPDPLRITRPNVTTPHELDELVAKIAADHPDVTHMEIFYQDQDDESTAIDMATFDGSCYIYRSTDNYNRAFQLMREAANT